MSSNLLAVLIPIVKHRYALQFCFQKFYNITSVTTRRFVRSKNDSLTNVNTNVVKDVIIYKYNKPYYFILINFFALMQCGLLTFWARMTFTNLRDFPVTKHEDTENTAWWRKINLDGDKFRFGLTGLLLFFGYAVLFGSWWFTSRNIRYLVLRKGGKSLSIVTYSYTARNKIMDVPLDKISAMGSRSAAKVTLPLKVEGHRGHYIIDMRGEFRNPELFDMTAGLNRTLKNKKK